MKNKNKIIVILLCSLFVFNACSEDEVGLNHSTEMAKNVTAQLLDMNGQPFTSLNSLTENGEPIEFQLVLSEPQIADLHFKLELEGDLTDDDVIYEHDLIIPAYASSITSSVTIVKDVAPEDTEVGSLVVNPLVANANLGANRIDFKVDNYTESDLKFTFAWDNGDVLIAAFNNSYPVCANTDVDVFIADAKRFDIKSPWGNTYADYDAATSDCPEEFVISVNEYPDGEYVFFSDLYGNAFAGYDTDSSFNISTTVSQAGIVAEATFSQDDDNSFYSYTAAAAFNGIVAYLTIKDGKYEVYDSLGNLVAKSL